MTVRPRRHCSCGIGENLLWRDVSSNRCGKGVTAGAGVMYSTTEAGVAATVVAGNVDAAVATLFAGAEAVNVTVLLGTPLVRK